MLVIERRNDIARCGTGIGVTSDFLFLFGREALAAPVPDRSVVRKRGIKAISACNRFRWVQIEAIKDPFCSLFGGFCKPHVDLNS
ncbi:hypothetical protein BJF91_19115 [Allorhizobium taibaishanense]|uniref:Uncharacterized protein n=1 Tax=Allorhizobium taibaishanense TaxID=887144 RepID=A0A1Q9A3L7_9HYPH|nr:hypothetical protein BJF91_19115 [Allorhizobium taibaishanense]